MSSVDKPLTPSLVVDDSDQDEEISVEVVDDPTVEVDSSGGVVVNFGNADEEEEIEVEDVGHYDNIVDLIPKKDKSKLAADVISNFDADRQSRKDWEKTYIDGLDLLGIKTETRAKPWPGAAGVFHPMLTEAVIRFQAEAMAELFPPTGPVKSKILGKVDKDKLSQAKRVEDEMNYLVTEKMPEYREETEQMLYRLALSGSGFKKTYYDQTMERAVSMFVPAEDFVVSYGSTDLMSSPRYTHVMMTEKNDLKKMQVSGFYSDVDVPDPMPQMDDVKTKHDKITGDSPSYREDERHTLLECHVDIELEEPFHDPDGIARPYIVTVEKSSSIVLSVRRNWKEDDPKKQKRIHFTHFRYLPGFGFYGTGLIHLIGGLAKSATSILRQLIDAGTLSNLPGGLKARGMRIKGDSTPIQPGEFRDVDVPGGVIKDSITYLPYKEPSSVLYQLLGNVVEEGRRIGSVADLDIGSVNAQAPVGTTLALMERSLKVMSGIQARLHASMKKELKLISTIVHENMDSEYEFDVGGEFSRTDDFDGRVDIIPVSDPNASTMAQRVMQYQAAIQLSAQAPQSYDVSLLHRGMLETLNIRNAEDIVKLPAEIEPSDPVTENMAIMKQEAVKAFLYQDHEAHIKVHMAAMEDPKLQQIIGQSPFAQAISSSMSAHITEHVAYQYRKEIEKNLGVPMPDENEVLPEDVEIEVSRMTAAAAEKLLGKNKAEAAAEEARKQQEDPLTVLQQREMAVKEAGMKHKIDLENKEFEEKVKVNKSNADIKKNAIDSTEKIAGANIGARIATEIDKGEKKAVTDGTRIGIEIAREMTDSAREKIESKKGKDNG